MKAMAPMSEPVKVNRVNAQIKAPKDGDAGQICVGYYVIRDGVLQMTNASGVKVLRVDGTPYEHKLRDGDNPAQIAARLTKTIRRMYRGESPAQERFAKPLTYPKSGWM
jgi:hypothetical protein